MKPIFYFLFAFELLRTDLVVTAQSESAAKNSAPQWMGGAAPEESAWFPVKNAVTELQTVTGAPAKSQLLKLYKIERPGERKARLAWALSYYSGTDIENALTFELLKTTGTLNWDGAASMLAAIHSLGFFAKDSDAAFALLKKGMDQKYWRKTLAWTLDKNAGRKRDKVLSSVSIQALGFSQRPEVPVLLQRLKHTSMGRSQSSALVSAAYYFDTLKADGINGFRRAVSVDTTEHLEKWTKTQNGQRWLAWRESIKTTRKK